MRLVKQGIARYSCCFPQTNLTRGTAVCTVWISVHPPIRGHLPWKDWTFSVIPWSYILTKIYRSGQTTWNVGTFLAGLKVVLSSQVSLSSPSHNIRSSVYPPKCVFLIFNLFNFYKTQDKSILQLKCMSKINSNPDSCPERNFWVEIILWHPCEFAKLIQPQIPSVSKQKDALISCKYLHRSVAVSVIVYVGRTISFRLKMEHFLEPCMQGCFKNQNRTETVCFLGL